MYICLVHVHMCTCAYVRIHRINQWKDTSTLWLHGYWQYDWADNYVKVLSIDHSSSEITIDPKTPTLYSMLPYTYVNHAKILSFHVLVLYKY